MSGSDGSDRYGIRNTLEPSPIVFLNMEKGWGEGARQFAE